MRTHSKDVEKMCRKLGATCSGRDARGSNWVFPDGAAYLVQRSLKGSAASDIMHRLQRRYGRVHNSVSAFPRVPAEDVPAVDLSRLVASTHAKMRMRLMEAQSPDASFAELARTVTNPRFVVLTPSTEELVWVGETLAVPLAFEDNAIVIKSVLWRSAHMYRDNPRESA